MKKIGLKKWDIINNGCIQDLIKNLCSEFVVEVEESLIYTFNHLYKILEGKI